MTGLEFALLFAMPAVAWLFFRFGQEDVRQDALLAAAVRRRDEVRPGNYNVAVTPDVTGLTHKDIDRMVAERYFPKELPDNR